MTKTIVIATIATLMMITTAYGVPSITVTGDVDPADPATWTTGTYCYIGKTGSGTLNITGGADVSNSRGYIGRESGSTGEVTVDGAGSTWTNSFYLYVGDTGNGTLNITSGGVVTTHYGRIGEQTGSTGEVTVDGEGSTLTCGSYLSLGHYSGSGTLSISDGGNVSSATGYVGRGSGSTGAVTQTGGTYAISGNLYLGYESSSEGTYDLTGGNLSADVIDVAYEGNGTGTFTLAGGNLQATVVKIGNGVFQGTGIADANMVNAGSVKPGNSPGLLEIDGDYTQETTGLLEIEIAGTGLSEFDRLDITGTADLSGTLEIVLLGGYQPSFGESFEIMTFGSRSGEFDQIDGLDIGNGLYFDPVYSSTSLNLEVVPEPATLSLLAFGDLALIKRRKA
jgi:T5SS/PEP-CTERM-associated repeat protein